MCSLFGSNDREEFLELAKLNSYRGTHSHSVAVIAKGLKVIAKDFGPLEESEFPEGYLIGHQQAPTTDASSTDNIHPSEGYGYLWHNGIIKEHQVKKWQEKFKMDEKWDTRLLHRHLEWNQFEGLSEADGSFACCFHFLGTTWIFRNDNCPLFVKGSTFSSTKFEGSETIKSGVVYKLHNNEWQETTRRFKTKEEFFWSPT